MAAKNEGKSKFLQSLKKQKGVDQAVKGAAKARDEFAPADIPDGQYVAKVKKVVCGEKDGNPRLTVVLVVAKGDHKGTSVRQTWFLSPVPPKNGKPGRTMAEIMNRFSVDLQAMGIEADLLESFESEGVEAIEAVIYWLETEQPTVGISVKNSGDRQYVNFRKTTAIKKEDESGEEDEDDAPESEDEGSGDDDGGSDGDVDSPAGDDEGEDSGDEDSGDDDVGGDDEDTETIPEVGDKVNYSPKKGIKKLPHAVTKVDGKKKTVTLIKVGDKTKTAIPNVPWSELEFVYED